MKPVQSLFSLVFRRPRYSRLAASPLAARMSRMLSRSFSLRIFEQKRDCSQSMFRVMKVGCYVTVDDGGNYVTFHGLNVRIKIKTITKAKLDSVSNRELNSTI